MFFSYDVITQYILLFQGYLILQSLNPPLNVLFLRLNSEELFGQRIPAVKLFVLLEHVPVTRNPLLVLLPMWINNFKIIHRKCQNEK